MSRTYKATGINLKSMPLGEADKLVTILTREFGLIRAVASGARKQNSKLGGRSGLFVVNDLLMSKGRSLDRITQAETLESYPGLSKNLGKLAASQYLAELVLCHALVEQPQEELYALLNEHLRRLDQLPKASSTYAETSSILAHLAQGVFHLLALAGIAPQVQACCVTQNLLTPDFNDPNWRVGFSVEAGGTVSLAGDNDHTQRLPQPVISKGGITKEKATSNDETETETYPMPRINTKLTATELSMLQQLAKAKLPSQLPAELMLDVDAVWVTIERILRNYAQYHFGQTIRSAALVEALSNPDF
jgi:DNA repair protein RecO (recombination protein O)